MAFKMWKDVQEVQRYQVRAVVSCRLCVFCFAVCVAGDGVRRRGGRGGRRVHAPRLSRRWAGDGGTERLILIFLGAKKKTRKKKVCFSSTLNHT